ncbi:hypothetical protein F0224_04925 [Vibrio coralliilyticus]|uniref:hypothetical protein n=1 Tax=Vibrio coralliilyticus TaxID=190893 RepID=UPI000BAC1E9E|nr:hypothetical protein [Vibrio coralliilyticus]NOI75013.1 hypothetical protein [Vibrio coralliilyticus]PAW05591.1 hypothetical protein CKJ79_04930 [Vibrio coralliilyticus]
MSLIIENNDLLIKQLNHSSVLTHENKSCESLDLSLSRAGNLLDDVANISQFLSSGSIRDESVVSALNDEMQDKLDTLRFMISCMEMGYEQGH